MIYHITCSTDDNYLQHCVAMLCSLFENNKGNCFFVHILIDKLSNNSRDAIITLCKRYENEVSFYHVNASLFSNIQLNDKIDFNGKQMYSIATYYRMILPSIIPENIDKILYLDCDIIVLRSVDELYCTNLEGYGVAAVKDCSPFDSYHRKKMGLSLAHSAFCAGMMMINLSYWRDNNSQGKLIEYSLRKWDNVYMQDQDALNYVFRDSWFCLPYKWGRTPLSIAPIDKTQRWFDINEFVNKPCIIHYAAHVKPWLDVWFPLQNYYWHYLRLSGFPNPQKTNANLKLRIKIYRSVMRYLINKNVRPFVPDFIELLLRDIFNIILLFVNILHPNHFKDYMLMRWFQKYGVM